MRLSVTPARLVVAPGGIAQLQLSVLNDGVEPLLPGIALRGVDPAMVRRLDSGVELQPGEEGLATIEVQIPVDALPGETPIAIAVTDVDGLHEPGLLVVEVAVGGRPPVSVEVDPARTEGRRVGRLDTVVRNHGTAPLDLVLSGASEAADVRFAVDEVQIGVGEALAIPTRVLRQKRTWFRELRHGVLIDVRGRGAPVSAATTFVQRPVFPPWLLKVTAMLAILALWAGAVVAIQRRLDEPQDTIAEQGVDGDGTDTGEDGADGEADGEPDAGEEGAEEEAEEGGDDAPGAAVIVAGETTGPRDPGGTRIIVERLSFGDEGTTGEGTKVAALTPVAAPVGVVVDRIETETDDRGRFSLSSGLAPSAFYRVSALRTGFEVASAVVRTEEEPAEYEVLLDLVPAPGAMSGRVTSTDGSPIGGAEVLIAGGDLTYRTVTGTDGATAGTWSIEGVAAGPGYGVTFRAPRFASATVVRALDGGQRLGDVDASLVPDLGTIRGLLSYRGEGVGAITVDLVGDEVERSTTTLTQDGLQGTFELPALSFGTYQLAFSAPGWLTQTTEVVVDRSDVFVEVGDLRPATAIVQGFVEQEVAPGPGCKYPDPADPVQRDDAVAAACGGVGVRLVGEAGTFSTTTATDTGSFTLSSLPPGAYTASFERFGYVPQYLQVELEAGDVLTLPDGAVGGTAAKRTAARTAAAGAGSAIVMRLVPPDATQTGEISAVLSSPGTLIEEGVELEVVGQPDAEVELGNDGLLRFSNIAPGAVTVLVRAPGHDVLSKIVRVGGTGVVDAGVLELTPLATVAVRVTDSGELPIDGAQVFLTTADPDDAATAVFDPTVGALPTDANPDGGTVEACRVDVDDAGRWRVTDAPEGDTLTGLCATVSESGDVSFGQAVGTGSYRLITPVNEEDTAADVDVSRVVPLDHEQLTRSVELQSGEVTRIDLRARRYAVIEGRIRKAIGAGYVDATAADFVPGFESFPDLGVSPDDRAVGVELKLYEDGVLVGDDTPAEGLRPRISFGVPEGWPDDAMKDGLTDDLPVGFYRISRVLPSEPDVNREYELIFAGSDGGTFEYSIEKNTSVTSLNFGETRAANAVLLPSPIEVEVEVLRERRSGVALPVQDMVVSAEGVVDVVYDTGGLLPIVKRSVGTTDATGATVLGELGNPAVPQPYLANRLLDLSLAKDGYYPLVTEQLIPNEDDRAKISVVATPLPRTVTGSVQLVPSGASVEDTLRDLDVRLETVGVGVPQSISAGRTLEIVGDELRFTFPDIAPDFYRLVVAGSGVFDETSEIFDIPPAPAGIPATVGPDGIDPDPAPFLIDAEVDLTVEVSESFAAVPGEPAATLDVEGATVRLRRDGILEGSPLTDADGNVTFQDLRPRDPTAPRATRTHTLEVSKPGYRTNLDAGAFTLDVAAPVKARSLVRFGAAETTLISVLTPDSTAPLGGAVATVLDAAGDPVLRDGSPLQFTSDPDGRLVVPATAELEPDPAPDPAPAPPPDPRYQLRIEAAGHDARTVPLSVVDATVTTLDDVELQQTRGAIKGVVTDVAPGSPPLANVRVRATADDAGGEVFDEVITGPDGTYEFLALPPRGLELVFEEFADAGATIPTSRRVERLPVTLLPDEELVRDVALVREYVAISGVVRSRTFADAAAPTTTLEGATVTATCTAGDCLGLSPLVRTTTSGPGGVYAFDVIATGTYDLTFTADGHDTPADRVAVVVRFGDALSTVTLDEVLIATPISVPASALSDRFGDLADLAVTATYVPPVAGDPVPTSATDGRFVLDGTTGAAGEPVALVLPPGTWSLSTSGATDPTTAPRPHLDGVETVTLAADDPTTAVDVDLTAYVEVVGTVRSRAHTLADSTPLAGATVAPSPQAAAPPAYPAAGSATPTGSGGGWSVLLPPTVGVGTATWELLADAADHEGAVLDVPLAAGAGDVTLSVPTPSGLAVRATGDLAPGFDDGTGGTGGLELTATPVAQPVLVTSPDDGVLDGVTVRATWNGTGAAPPSHPSYVVELTSGTDEEDLVLAPGPWLLSTVGADTAAGLPTRAPHQDAAGVSATPTIGVTSPRVTLDLLRWASITGDVETLAFPGATPVSPTDATATVSDPPTGVAEAGSDADGVDGRWRVWIEDPADATVTLTKPGFSGPAASVLSTDFVTRDLVVAAPVTLTAGERDVDVTVVSSVGGGGLSGITVVASDPTGSLPDRTATTVAGVASFTGAQQLAPVEWEFTTTTEPALPEPHKKITSADGVRRTIPAGDGTYALSGAGGGDTDERLTMTRYASITGTVGTRNRPATVLTLRNDVQVSAIGPASAIAEPLSGVDGTLGRWRVWLPDPELAGIAFELPGYTTPGNPVVLDVTAGAQRDITRDTPVSLVAIPRTVEVLVVSQADAAPLAGVDVLATAPGLSTRTARTDAAGVASFSDGTTDRRLPPAVWTLTTDRATDILPPHHDAVTADGETRRVDPGAGTLVLDSTTADADDERLVLERYASVTGTVGTRAFTGAAVVPSNAPGLSLTAPTADAVVELPGAVTTLGAGSATGLWRVWVPQPEAVTASFTLTGYLGDSSSVVAGDFASDDDITAPDAVLLGTPRDVTVSVVSSDGTPLANDVKVIATGPGTAGAPGPFEAVTDATGVARFLTANNEALAPTTWTFTTDDADAHDPPHDDLDTPAEAEARVVPAGTTTLALDQSAAGHARERLQLQKYAMVEGLVKTRGAIAGTATASEAVTVSETSSTGAVVYSPADIGGPLGTWRAWAKEGSALALDFTLPAHGTESRPYAMAGSVAVPDVVLTAAARPATVTAVAREDDGITFDGVAITLTGEGALPDHGPETTGPAGIADFGSIEPLQYLVTTTGADALGRVDLVASDSYTVTFTPGDTTENIDLPLTRDTLPPPVGGEVVEYVNGSPVRIADVIVTGTRGGEVYPMPASTAPASGNNYQLQLPAGTWEITAERSSGGPSVLADAAYTMPTAGAGTAPTVVMPTASGPDLTGTVTNDAGGPVDGATVTAVSGAQTRTATSDENGDYAIIGLDPGVTWAVTYAPPASAGGVPVTRFIAPGGSGTDIALSQEVPADLGSIEVDITDGPASTSVTVVLTETGTPFPTVDADGIIEVTVALNGSGRGTATFTGLVPGDDVSIPHDRFDVTIEGVTGYFDFAAPDNEVTAGATTTVPAALVAEPPPTRPVDLTVTDASGDVIDKAAELKKGPETIVGTVAAGSNVYEFAAVEADATWSLEIPGYEPKDVVIPAGTTLHTAAVTVTPSPREVVLTLSDVDGAVSGTATLDDGSATPPTATGAAGVFTFADVAPGTTTLQLTGYDDESVTVPVDAGSYSESITMTRTVRDVVLTLDDGTGVVTGAAPTLARTGYADVSGVEDGTTGVYTFAGVAHGDWTLEVTGYDDEAVAVPVGSGDHSDSVTLTP